MLSDAFYNIATHPNIEPPSLLRLNYIYVICHFFRSCPALLTLHRLPAGRQGIYLERLTLYLFFNKIKAGITVLK